jgi:hypothetical protein
MKTKLLVCLHIQTNTLGPAGSSFRIEQDQTTSCDENSLSHFGHLGLTEILAWVI